MRAIWRNAGWRAWISGAPGNHPRHFADRGLHRRDYTDPGYRSNGYINPSCFSGTHEGRFRSEELPKDPVFCGSEEDERALRRRKRMGDARRMFEEQRLKQEQAASETGATSSSTSRRIDPPRVEFKDEIVPEADLLPKAPKPQKRERGQRVILFKGRIQRDSYDDLEYKNSGLDEFTNRLDEKSKQKRNE